jgi:Tol biopolymer transport system component
MMMKKILMLATVVLLFALGAGTALAQSGYDLFQKALVKERAVGDVEEALRLYQRIVKEFSGNHALAAKAELRMGLLYDRLGRKADAQRAYQAVVNQYADQTNEARQARAKIVVAPARTRLAAGTRRLTSPADLSYHVAWKMPGRRTYPSSMSPDGRYIAYENWDEEDDLFLHDLVTGTDRRLTKAAGANEEAQGESAFSRDGKQLAYGWTNNQRDFELRVIDLQGSGIPQPRRLFVDQDVSWVGPWDWTPDGKWIAGEVDRNDRTRQIALISTSGGSLRVLKSFTGSKTWWAPMCISPDAKYLAFDLRTGPDKASAKSDIFVLAIDGRQEIPAVVNPADDELVGWSADETRLIFTSDRTGSRSLFALPVRDGRPQGEPQLIRPDVGPVRFLGLTTSGSLFSFEKAGANADVKIGSFDFSTGEILSPPTDLLLQDFAGSNKSPDWSPDGKFLAYVVQHGSRAGECTLAIRSLETDQVQELRPQLGRMDWLRWAPDGKSFVISASDRKGVSGLWRVDRVTAEVSAIAPTGTYAGGDIGFQGWSPDARKIYYYRMRMLSGDQVLVLFERDLASGLERELYQAGPWFVASLSADGKKLYYRKGKAYVTEPSALQAALIERDLSSGVEKELIRGNLGGAALSPDGQYIATSTVDLATKSQSIMLVPVAGGEPRVLMRVPLPQSVIDRWVLAKNLNQLNMLRILWASDSRSLVVEHTQAKPEQWWVPMDGQESAKRVSLGVNLWNVRVHPDGRRIAMAEQQPPRPAEVWVRENLLPKLATKTTASRR